MSKKLNILTLGIVVVCFLLFSVQSAGAFSYRAFLQNSLVGEQQVSSPANSGNDVVSDFWTRRRPVVTEQEQKEQPTTPKYSEPEQQQPEQDQPQQEEEEQPQQSILMEDFWNRRRNYNQPTTPDTSDDEQQPEQSEVDWTVTTRERHG